jgi:hypothetical protein
MGEGEWTVVTPRSHRKQQRRSSTPISSGTGERGIKSGSKAGTRYGNCSSVVASKT